MSDLPTQRPRRWFRFSLVGLFCLVTIAAVLCWFFMIGLPAWQLHREQVAFEESVKQLKAGMSEVDCRGFVKSGATSTSIVQCPNYNSKGEAAFMIVHAWGNRCYLIFYTLRRNFRGSPLSAPCTSVQVYRLPQAPRNYRSRGRWNVPADDSLRAYAFDFGAMLVGHLEASPDLQYELIYSDPAVPASDPSR